MAILRYGTALVLAGLVVIAVSEPGVSYCVLCNSIQ